MPIALLMGRLAWTTVLVVMVGVAWEARESQTTMVTVSRCMVEWQWWVLMGSEEELKCWWWQWADIWRGWQWWVLMYGKQGRTEWWWWQWADIQWEWQWWALMLCAIFRNLYLTTEGDQSLADVQLCLMTCCGGVQQAQIATAPKRFGDTEL
jgi:hypothetical protein